MINLQNKAYKQTESLGFKKDPSPPPALDPAKNKATLASDFIKQMLNKNRSPKHVALPSSQ